MKDVLQEVRIKILTALPRFESRARIGTWAHRIAQNAVKDAGYGDAKNHWRTGTKPERRWEAHSKTRKRRWTTSNAKKNASCARKRWCG